MRNLCKALAATAVLIGVIGGLPVLFIRIGSWPIHRVPSLDAVRALPTQALTDDAVLAVLTVIAWLAWAAFTASVAIELCAQLAGTRRWRLPLAAPVQMGARQLVASMLLVLSMGSPFAGHALAMPLTRGVVATMPTGHVPTTSTTPMTSTTSATSTTSSTSGTSGAASPDALVRVPDSASAGSGPSPEALRRLPEPGDLITTPSGATPSTTDPRLPGRTPLPGTGTHAPPAQPIRPPSGRAAPPDSIGPQGRGPAATAVPPGPPPHAMASPTTAEASLPQVVVAAGDSPWGLAERHLHDGLRWREIFELNQARVQADGSRWTDPQLLSVGWVLSLPANALGATSPAAAPAVSTAGADLPTTWTVRPGDTLAGIADSVWGDATRFADLFTANAGNPQPDGRTLTDPNLILPGWRLHVPEALVPPVPMAEPELPPRAAPPGARTEPTGPGTGATEPSDDAIPDGTEPAEHTPSSDSVDPTKPTKPVDSIEPVDPVAVDEPVEVPDPGPASGPREPSPAVTSSPPATTTASADELLPALVPAVVGITGALVLATAAAERLRRRRQRRALRAAHLGGRSDDDLAEPVARAVLAAADVPLVRWAGQVLAEAMAGPEAAQAPGVPVTIELGEDGLEVHWSAPAVPAPASWVLEAGGWSWHLPYDPDAPIPADERTAILPALVTLGRRGSRSLMVNIEAFGALGVSGPPDAVAGLLRAMATELSTSADLADAYVSVVNLTVPHDSSSPDARLRTVTVEEAHARLSSTTDAAGAALDPERSATTFAHRAGPDGVPLEVIVVVAAAPRDDAAARLIAAAPAHRGVGLVLDDEPGRCEARVVINDDGHAVLYPLGIGFTAADLPAETADALAEVERRPPAHPVATDGPVPIEAAAGDISETTAVTSAPTALLVRILGAPRVTDRAELGTRGVSLVAYLACRRRPATTSHIQEALWGGRPVQAKTIWNVVSRTRVALGSLPDGTAAFPAGDATNRTFTLAPGVRTDADLLREAYDRQRSQPDDPVAVRALAAALELVEGPPFDGPGFEWAYREGQHAAAAGHLIEQAALAVANDATRRGDLAAARHALARGLVGLPGNEVLYRARLSLEAEVGNRVGVEAVFRELVGFLEDLDAEPSPETVAHYAALLRPSVSHDTR